MLINLPDYQHLRFTKSVDFVDLHTVKSSVLTSYLFIKPTN